LEGLLEGLCAQLPSISCHYAMQSGGFITGISAENDVPAASQ
jgi:hypothetical protein